MIDRRLLLRSAFGAVALGAAGCAAAPTARSSPVFPPVGPPSTVPPPMPTAAVPTDAVPTTALPIREPLPDAVTAALAAAWPRLAEAADADPGSGYPRSATAGARRWTTAPVRDWTGGFFPGSLWFALELTGDPAWRDRARRWSAPLASQASRTDSHDLGFVLEPSIGAQARLTGAGPDTVQAAARSLATRFSPRVQAIKSWDTSGDSDKRRSWRFPVIADTLMNLDLLRHAAALPGGDPRHADIATAHARTAARTNARPDGSTAHVALFDPGSGTFLGRETWQGRSPTSTWSRGQGWAIHGFTAAARASGDADLRAAAVRAGDWWVAHVPPEGVPAWDFDAPDEERDTSAAAVAAAGLLDLADLTGDRRYRDAARTSLVTLATRYVAASGPALLDHAVGGKPQGAEVDVGLVYGDHYFLESVRRWRLGLPGAR